MRIFKAMYLDRKGRKRKSAKWYVEFTDHLETRRRVPGFVDKKATGELGRQIERLVAFRSNRQAPDVELGRWIEGLHSKLRDRLLKIGLLDSRRAGSAKPLKEHLVDFKTALAAKGGTEQNVKEKESKIGRVLKGCRFTYWSEIRPSTVLGFLASLREEPKGISVQTSNHYLRAMKQFTRWMVRDRRASEDPITHLEIGNVRTDRRHVRRPLSVDECRKLLDAARGGEPRGGMTGTERALLYRLALETGLRSSELRSLTRGSFDFEASPPTVRVEAGYSKHRREDVLPLRDELASDLEVYLGLKLASAIALPVPQKHGVVKMLRFDLEAEEIPYRDESGRVADFHSLRHTFATNLANSGVHPKVAQDLLRHGDINLTMSVYTHTHLASQAEALDNLPDLSKQIGTAEEKDTGTN